MGSHDFGKDFLEAIDMEKAIDALDAPRPSDYDLAHLADILAGEGDWFGAMLFRLIMKADGSNIERLRRAYPFHVHAYEDWRNR